MTTGTPHSTIEMSCQSLQTVFCSYMKMSICGYIMPGHAFPEQVICSRRLWYLQSIDLNVRKRIGFLPNMSETREFVSCMLTLSCAILLSSRMTAWTVAVFPVPGTPEISVHIVSSVGRGSMNVLHVQIQPPLPSSSSSPVHRRTC